MSGLSLAGAKPLKPLKSRLLGKIPLWQSNCVYDPAQVIRRARGKRQWTDVHCERRLLRVGLDCASRKGMRLKADMTKTVRIPFLDLVSMHRELKDELNEVFNAALDTGGFIGGPRTAAGSVNV